MGVTGLWELLKPQERLIQVAQLQRCTVGCEAKSFFKKITNDHLIQLAQGQTTAFVQRCADKVVDLQRRLGFSLVIVFEGLSPPMKPSKSQREVERARCKSLAAELLAFGQVTVVGKLLAKVPNAFRRCVPELVKGLTARGIQCAVAPFGGEAQLAYLSRANLIHAVWSEDSDVVMFGAHLVFRDVDFASLQIVAYDIVGTTAADTNLDAVAKRPELLALACSLAGTDFTPGFNVPLAVAINAVVARSDVSFMAVLDGVQQEFKLSADDVRTLHRAVYSIVYHTVYNPTTNCCEPAYVAPEGTTLPADVVGEIKHAQGSDAMKAAYSSGRWDPEAPDELPLSLAEELRATPEMLFGMDPEPIESAKGTFWCHCCRQAIDEQYTATHKKSIIHERAELLVSCRQKLLADPKAKEFAHLGWLRELLLPPKPAARPQQLSTPSVSEVPAVGPPVALVWAPTESTLLDLAKPIPAWTDADASVEQAPPIKNLSTLESIGDAGIEQVARRQPRPFDNPINKI